MPSPPKGKSRDSKGKTKAQTKKSTAKISKSKSRSKAKASPKKKKRRPASRRKTSIGTGLKSSLILLISGVVIGVLAAVIILYFLGAFEHITSPQAAPKILPRTKPAPKERRAESPPAFEENNQLDKQIKQVDQALLLILGELNIPEKNIRFTQLVRKKSRALEWHLATIEIILERDIKAERLTEALESAFQKLSIHPGPRMTTSSEGRITSVKLSINGLQTHVLRLVTPKQASLPPPSPAPGVKKPKVALVIDDLGQDMRLAECFLKINAPMAFAILPFQPYSQEMARTVHEAGQVVMLHLPMEPAQYPEFNPGTGALFRTMDRGQVEEAVLAAIQDVPHLSGVNNHMGSRFTEDSERMTWVLEELKRQDLFFLDSRTSARTKANSLARRLGIKTAERAVFLDNVQEEEAIRAQLKRLVALARQKGQAIAIGHPYYETCQVLTDEYNYLLSKVELVPVTSLVH